MKQVLALIAIVFSLQGCIFVAGAAAGAAGIAVVYDHRKIEAVVLDQNITKMVAANINKNPEQRESSHIEVTTFNRIVLLTGQTTSAALRKEAEDIARSTADVQRVYNEITVKGPSSSLTRASDSWITAKIKTQMLAMKDLKSSSIKVVTENGSVYLMGIVSHQQADIAVDIARQVAGVQRVIKIFQYKD